MECSHWIGFGRGEARIQKKSDNEIRHNWRHKTYAKTHTILYSIFWLDTIFFLFVFSFHFDCECLKFVCANFNFGRISLPFISNFIIVQLRNRSVVTTTARPIRIKNSSEIIIIVLNYADKRCKNGTHKREFHTRYSITHDSYTLRWLTSLRMRWITTQQFHMCEKECVDKIWFNLLGIYLELRQWLALKILGSNCLKICLFNYKFSQPSKYRWPYTSMAFEHQFYS